MKLGEREGDAESSPYRPISTPTLAEVSSINSRELSAFSPQPQWKTGHS